MIPPSSQGQDSRHDDRFRLGVDLGGSRMTVGVFDSRWQRLAIVTRPTPTCRSVAAIVDHLVDSVNVTLRSANVLPASIPVAGIGLPGEVDVASGTFHSSPILPAWFDVPIAQMLQERLGIRFQIENDANAALIGEHTALGQGEEGVIVLITLGTGVGGAISVNGKIHHGRDNSAGEFGHISVADHGPPCGCGNIGCLGKFASATALVDYYRDLSKPSNVNQINGEVVSKQFFAGEPAAIAAVDHLSHFLAKGVATITSVLAPRRVILAGGIISSLGVHIARTVTQTLQSRRYPRAISQVQVTPASLNPYSAVIGAATLY